ncbi:MAG TPA: hypothetical protein VE958_13235 [Bryobacteraceae bacterium]|jgi:hypothetical protein|nr:hypothetical protein [Bryobacteraceae bacterium]
MTLTERCQAGEAKLEQVSTALLDPRPEVLDRCEAELQEVIGLLESEPGLTAGNTSDRDYLLRLRRRIRLLAVQAQHAANLIQGWVQLGLSEGYTDQGKPVLPLGEPHSSFEV